MTFSPLVLKLKKLEVVGGYSWRGSHLKVSSVIKQLNLTCDTKNVLALNLAWLYSPSPINLSHSPKSAAWPSAWFVPIL